MGRAGAVVGVLLAAGRGRRFDPTGHANKLLARLTDGRTVLATALGTLLAAVDEVVLVVPPGATDVRAALGDTARTEWLVNPDALTGIGSSLATGIRARPDAAGWLIALGDMPFIRPESVRAVAQALCQPGVEVVAPLYRGERGHPVGFSAPLYPELITLGGDEGARRVVLRHAVTEVVTNDSGILRDIDTPTDLPSSS